VRFAFSMQPSGADLAFAAHRPRVAPANFKSTGHILCRPILGGLHHQYGPDLIYDRHSLQPLTQCRRSGQAAMAPEHVKFLTLIISWQNAGSDGVAPFDDHGQ
jgi:hypothetical protein